MVNKLIAVAVFTAGAGSCWTAQAVDAFPALARPALAARNPQHQVMQAAALAGRRIVAVGERGIVVLSDDGGQRWRQARLVPSSTTLTAVSFAGDKLGWAVGHGGIVLHSADGGETWRKLIDGTGLAQAALRAAEARAAASPGDLSAARALRAAQALVADGPDKPLLDVHFADARRGWIAGAYGLLFDTEDGGASWRSLGDRIDNPRALHLYALGVRGRTLYVAGEGGQLHRSLDGGHSFTTLASPYKGSWFAMALEGDDGLLLAGLRGNAWRSRDRGATWEALAGTPPVSFVAAALLADGSTLLANGAGQLFVATSGGQLRQMPVVPLPPAASVLPLEDGALVVLGFGGVHRIAAARKETSR